jgi:benzil reductase ((S)-benzoin forming)
VRSFVITGVSRGLGAAFFTQLATDGENRIVGLGRTFTDEQRRLAAAEPGRISLVETDFAATANLDLERPLHAAIRRASHGYLILNAGMVEPVGAVGSLRPADVANSVAVNLTAPMIMADAFVRALPATTPATVLFISSGAATRPIEGWAAYCAAKAGGEMFFRVLAEERPGLRVASVNPGRMDTAMQDALRRSEFPSRQSYVDAHEHRQLAQPADVAARIISEHVTRA